MADWTFVAGYGAQFPSLQVSALGALAFSDHAIAGTAFTGTLDVAASGAALGTIGAMLGVSSIPIAGTVTATGTTLTVSLRTTQDAAYGAAIGSAVPLLGKAVQKAWLTVSTVAATTDDPDLGPATDELDVNVEIAIGTSTATIASRVPMNGGFAILSGTFEGFGVGLSDLEFLLGGDSAQWFPAADLGGFYHSGTKLELLALSVTLYVALAPFSVSVSSVSATIGIVDIPILEPKLYLNPLAVVVTVPAPGSSQPPSYGLEGFAVLTNYEKPDPQQPDFTFEVALVVTGSSPNRTFSLSGQFENPKNLTIAQMLKDLFGGSTDIGLSPSLTLTAFDLDATIAQASGSLTDFSGDIAMSGGFGLFQHFDLESISVSVAYSA